MFFLPLCQELHIKRISRAVHNILSMLNVSVFVADTVITRAFALHCYIASYRIVSQTDIQYVLTIKSHNWTYVSI